MPPSGKTKKRAEPPVKLHYQEFQVSDGIPDAARQMAACYDYGRETNIFQKTRLQM
jgi:hypothetical protein